MQTVFQRLELGRQVGLTTDLFLLLLIQDGEDLNMMRADPARAIVKSGLMSTKNSLGRIFYPQLELCVSRELSCTSLPLGWQDKDSLGPLPELVVVDESFSLSITSSKQLLQL